MQCLLYFQISLNFTFINLLDDIQSFYKFHTGDLDLAYYVSPDFPESVFIGAAVVMGIMGIFAWTTNLIVVVAYIRNRFVRKYQNMQKFP